MGCDLISSLTTSDYVNLVGILANVGLAIWIVKVLQNNLTNKRYLKDHLIEEVKELRHGYSKFLNELQSGNMKPQKIAPWFKLMNIRVQDLMELINEKYNIDKNYLSSYQRDLRDLVTEFDEYINNYQANNFIQLESQSLTDLIQFQQKNRSSFSKLILLINNK